jgi:phosphoheptose isomerase
MDLDIRPLTLVPTLQQMFAPQSLEPVVELLHQARLSRVNVFVCGRGASAVTVARLVDRLNREAVAPGMPRFRAVALADASVSGAVALAFGEQGGLVEPLRNMLRPGDVVVSMDCDDYCPLDAPAVLRYARQMGARTVALAGEAGDTLAAEADMAVRLPGPAAAERRTWNWWTPSSRRSASALPAIGAGLILAGGRSATPEQPAVLPGTPKRRAILLDRDGVINVNRDDYVKNWEEIELLPGVIDALRLLAQSPYPIVVVTNQSAVNRNHMSYEMAENINLRLMQTVAAQGGVSTPWPGARTVPTRSASAASRARACSPIRPIASTWIYSLLTWWVTPRVTWRPAWRWVARRLWCSPGGARRSACGCRCAGAIAAGCSLISKPRLSGSWPTAMPVSSHTWRNWRLRGPDILATR